MAKGDAVGAGASVNAAGVLEIKPGAGVEWVIHNIYHEAEVNLYTVHGAVQFVFASSGGKGSWSAYFFHLTNTHYMKVENTNASAKRIGYDGIVSKE
jgi:hypothetical protein